MGAPRRGEYTKGHLCCPAIGHCVCRSSDCMLRHVAATHTSAHWDPEWSSVLRQVQCSWCWQIRACSSG